MPAINLRKEIYDELIRRNIPEVPRYVNEAVEMRMKQEAKKR